jgi:hypothetical protein
MGRAPITKARTPSRRAFTSTRPPAAPCLHSTHPPESSKSQAISVRASDRPSSLEFGDLTQRAGGAKTAGTTLSERREQVSTGFCARAADLGADAAVLVVGGMLLALLGARLTGQRAAHSSRTEDVEV